MSKSHIFRCLTCVIIEKPENENKLKEKRRIKLAILIFF
jgi:hypothetical protein